MNKKQAEKFIRENDPTIGDLRRALHEAPSGGASIVNPQMSKAQALEIFLEAIAHRADTDKLRNSGRAGASDFLIARNIIRECM